jgi:hypothetical protein
MALFKLGALGKYLLYHRESAKPSTGQDAELDSLGPWFRNAVDDMAKTTRTEPARGHMADQIPCTYILNMQLPRTSTFSRYYPFVAPILMYMHM